MTILEIYTVIVTSGLAQGTLNDGIYTRLNGAVVHTKWCDCAGKENDATQLCRLYQLGINFIYSPYPLRQDQLNGQKTLNWRQMRVK